MTRQLPLDLPHRAALSAEDFLVAGCNRLAVDWLDRWPDWPGPGLILWGPAGSGKTHLAHVFARNSGAAILSAAALAPANVPDLALRRHLVLEDCDRGFDETALFHLHNMIAEAKGSLLLTARAPVHRWAPKLADLRSRLLALPSAAIDDPDDELIAAVLVKLFADRQVTVGAEAIDYLLRQMERSFAAARALAEAADKKALALKRSITIPLLREVLTALEEKRREGEKP